VGEISFDNLLIVVVAGFAAPLALGLVPGLRLPSVVLEIVIGIVIGPAVLGWIEVDDPVEVLALIGLAFLLFLAGLEIDLGALRGALLRAASLGFAASLVLALIAGFALDLAGIGDEPLLLAVILTSTSLGVIVPVLHDAGESGTRFGQLVIAAASIADFVSVLLLSFLFSGEASGIGTKLTLIGIFVLAIAAALLAVMEAEHSRRLSAALVRLQDTSAQIRVRGAFVLLIGMSDTRNKLAAVGYGIFIPVFFVSSGVKFDLDALFASSTALLAIPAFVAALLFARGLPALIYRGQLDRRRVYAAALLQATSLPFIVAATQIGQSLDVIDAATSAGLIAAGLVTVLVFPVTALSLLGGGPRRTGPSPTTAGGSL